MFADQSVVVGWITQKNCERILIKFCGRVVQIGRFWSCSGRVLSVGQASRLGNAWQFVAVVV